MSVGSGFEGNDDGTGAFAGFRLVQQDSPRMEPRLQYLLRQGGRHGALAASASTIPDEVAVIALVKKAEDWTEHPDVVPGILIPASESTFIATGRVPLKRLPVLEQAPGILSLKATQPLWPSLQFGITDIHADVVANRLGGMGTDVVVGIIDFGCDFAHRNFRHADGTSRIEAIWEQGAPRTPNGGVSYGKVHTKASIDAALATSDPYGTLGYGPRPDTPTLKGEHGTHVMDIAAGNGRGSSVPGVASDAIILFVEVDGSDVPWQGASVVDKNYGDSVRLLEAVRWIFDQAGNRPCVVNISLGTNGGPHDGSNLVEQGLDELLRERADSAVVIAASNSYADDIHASGGIDPGDFADLIWSIPSGGQGHAEVEIWYEGTHELSVELINPLGTSHGMVPWHRSAVLDDAGTKVMFFLSTARQDPINLDYTRGAFIEAVMPKGDWILRLRNDGGVPIAFHAWIERNDGGQSGFNGPYLDKTCTLGSISCGFESISVGSYDAHKAATPLSYFSSAGPTRDGRQKPEVSAPGHSVEAAHSRTSTGVVRMSGTSMAAPMVTGAVAVLLGEARRAGIVLTSSEIRRIVELSARSDHGQWDSRYGFGRLDLDAMLDELIHLKNNINVP